MTTTNEPPINVERRRRLWLAFGAAAVIILVAVILFLQDSSTEPDGSPVSSPAVTTTTTTEVATEPVVGSAVPTVSPKTTLVTPSESPTLQPPSTPSTPRKQPTKNEDSAPRESKEPVEITAEATPTEGVEARLVLIEPVNGLVAIPGEVAGPALRITLEVVNNTKKSFPTPAVVVNLYKGASMSPAGTLLKPGGEAFPPQIATGGTGRGVYLFNVAEAERDNITIEVDLAVGTPVVLFQGAVK